MAAITQGHSQIDATFTSEPDPSTAFRGSVLNAGIYYSTHPEPDVYGDTKTSLTYTAPYTTTPKKYQHTIKIYDTEPDSTHYVKAYVTNIIGTYSSSVYTVPPNPLGKVQINSQIWTSQNSTVTTYSDGTPITLAPNQAEWQNATIGMYTQNNGITYYNWYAVAGIYDTNSQNNPALRKKLAPSGYHVPTDAEWDTLTTWLSGASVAGGKMKSTANHPCQFSAVGTGHVLPGYVRDGTDTGNIYFWSSTEIDATNANMRAILNSGTAILKNNNSVSTKTLKTHGFPVRFISDAIVAIGQQLWTTRDLNITRYSDNTPISFISSPNGTYPLYIEYLTTGHWAYLDMDYQNSKIFGRLYNWYAFMGIHDEASRTDPTRRKKLVDNYHKPSLMEWEKLEDYLGGEKLSGIAMRANSDLWGDSQRTNSSGFTGLPSRELSYLGGFGYFPLTTVSYWSTDMWYGGNPNDPKSDSYAIARTISSLSSFGTYAVADKVGTCKPIRLLSNVTNQTPVNIVGSSYNQTWSKTNLDIETYRDGTPVLYASSSAEWQAAAAQGVGAWCYYDYIPVPEANDPYGFDAAAKTRSSQHGVTYGKLYNWYAVNNSTNGGLAPDKWRIPTDAEWTALTTAINTQNTAGNIGQKMKENSTLWTANTGNNSSGFTGLPGGVRNESGASLSKGINGQWWSSTPDGATTAFSRTLAGNSNDIIRTSNNKASGFSVRLIREYS